MHYPSSVAVAQGFSLLDHIYAKRRHRLSHSTIEKLMILHEQAPEFNTEEMGNILPYMLLPCFSATSVTGSRENGGRRSWKTSLPPYLFPELSL